ncbi:conjugal transfer protein [Weissella coleopterorum]|uniref:Conjugal transfer protein n=1 Tax=Weissella coleopterorum TaxID=2714949 RepID=A0A6G8AXU0_9LACO|nr:ATP-binding protein [Weissella coleopterorum]QIL49921.1 conjugal transfer protein [Weissella coleopterorum]
MANRASIKYENPVIEYNENLVLTRTGEVWAYFKIKPFQINVANIEEKRAYKSTLTDVLERLQKYEDVDLKLLPADMDLAGRIQGTHEDWAKDLSDVAEYYLGQEEVNMLQAEFKPAVIDEFYIGVKLRATAIGDGIKEQFANASDLLVKRVADMMKFQVKFDDDFFKRYEVMNTDVLGILRPLNATKLKAESLAKLLGYSYHNEHSKTLEDMRDTIFDPGQHGIIQRDNGEEVDYVANLVINLPDNLELLELIPEIQSFKFPVEVHFKINYPKRDGVFGINTSAKQSKGKYKDELVDAEMTNDDSSSKSQDNFSLSSDLVDVLDSKDAFMAWTMILVVRDYDLEALRQKIRLLKTRINSYDRGISVYQPNFEQVMLLYQILPGTKLGVFKQWQQFTKVPAFVELMFGITSQIGTRTGFYVGRVLDLKQYDSVEMAAAASRVLLLMNPIISNKGIKGAKTDSPHIVITGNTGNGKSFATKDLMFHLAMFDIDMVSFDPKQEIRRWFNRALQNVPNEYFQKLIKSFHFITLDSRNSENNGVLDPLLTLNENSTADDIPEIVTLIKEMLVQIRSVSYSLKLETNLNDAIRSLCERRLMGEQIGTLAIIEKLREMGDDASDLADYYQSIIPNSMLRLAFGDGSSDGLTFDHQRTILEVTGLDLPKPNQDARLYTETNKQSISIMLALGKYMEKFGRSKTDRFSLEILDEAWIFESSEAGKKVLDSIKRLGRSENNMLISSTQRVADVNNADSTGQYGQIFAFDDPDDRPNILRQFGLPVNDDNIKMLQDLKKGQCLYRDIYGRVGKVVVHVLFNEWLEAFKTVDSNSSALLEGTYE